VCYRKLIAARAMHAYAGVISMRTGLSFPKLDWCVSMVGIQFAACTILSRCSPRSVIAFKGTSASLALPLEGFALSAYGL
jgi:hypothetical protein